MGLQPNVSNEVSLPALLSPDIEAPPQTDVLLQVVSSEQFEAVPEHGGSIQKLVERYGDNPGSCPYIKSMGEAGIQLVERLAEAEKNPDRGPTMRELMEARKKEAQIAAVPSQKTEQPADNKIVEMHTAPDKSVPPIIPEITHTVSAPEVAHPATVRPAIIELETEYLLLRQVVDTEMPHAHSEPVIAPRVAPIPPTISEHPPQAIELAERPIVEPAIHQQDLVAAPYDQAPEAIEPILAELTPQVFEAPQITDEIEGTPIVVSPMLIEPLQPAPTEEPILLLETPVWTTDTPTLRIDLESAPDSIVTTPMPLFETARPIAPEIDKAKTLHEALNSYFNVLEPASAEVAEKALESLVTAMHLLAPEIISEPDGAADQLQEIEQQVSALLSALHIPVNPNTESVLTVMQQLLLPLEATSTYAEEAQHFLPQLTDVGTHEYHFDSLAALLARVMRSISQRLPSLPVGLGHYALAGMR